MSAGSWRQRRLTAALAAAVSALAPASRAQAPIPIMILDGESGGSYHDWARTTPALRSMLDETRLFAVTVVTAPPAGADFSGFRPAFDRYRAVVLNYDAPDERWPDTLKSSFEAYVRGGGGVIAVHAANNAFPGWAAYNEMLGVGGWRGRTEAAGPRWFYDDGRLVSDSSPGTAGSHGKRLPFEVRVRAPDHPIVKGLPATWTHGADELYARLRGPGRNMTVLATAYSDPANAGSGRHEPQLMVLSFGKGRIFHTTWGHDLTALASPNFKVTFQRGTEWAATGAVTAGARGASDRRFEVPPGTQLFETALRAKPAPPAQAVPGGRGASQPPQFTSAEVTADRRITFRVFAPRAEAVRLAAGDIPGMTPAVAAMTKSENGVWEATVGPVPPGAYRYNFNIDGVATIDPRSSVISESNANVWSLVVVPGHDVFDTKNVPRGAVAAVTYWSTALSTFRRMHVYTPPGYERGDGRYPVFYLLHGAGDNDHAWSSVGRAGFILDNLIAAGKARPMVVVMPAGHTPRATGGAVGAGATQAFVSDFVHDVMPYIESRYRVRKDRASTAIAGLSMGGQQTLAAAIPRLGRFGYIGVFSSGLISAFPELGRRGGGNAPAPARGAAPVAGRAAQASAAPTAADWEKANAATLDDAALKKGLRLLWFATGKEDFLLRTTQATVELLKKHGFAPVYLETGGGHTWINWRDYLAEFAPQLFR